MEKKLAEYKCETNDAISLKLGTFTTCSVTHYMSPVEIVFTLACVWSYAVMRFYICIPLKVIAFFL